MNQQVMMRKLMKMKQEIEKTTEEKMAKYQALLGGFGGGLF